MNELELWMNPNLSIEERFEIARGEIARLNEVIAKMQACAPAPTRTFGPIRVGSKIVIGPESPTIPGRSYQYDYATCSLFMSGEPKEVLSIDEDDNSGEVVYNVRVGNWIYGIYLDWIKSVE